MTTNHASLTIAALCARAPVIPVLTIEHADHAIPLGRALIAGGLPVLEVTLRTSAALDAVAAMSTLDGAVVGAGTLLSANDVSAAKEAGAQFGVSPGATPAVLDACEEARLPLLPGVATATEAMGLLARGFDVVKFFPAEAAGGIAVLKAFSAPFARLRFCPTGGITAANAGAYLSLPNVLCVGGSWVAPQALVNAGDWGEIERLARQASGL